MLTARPHFDRAAQPLRARCCTACCNYVPVTAYSRSSCSAASTSFIAGAKTELAPQEDQGIIITLVHRRRPTRRCSSAAVLATRSTRLRQPPETDHVFSSTSPGQSIAGMVLKPWDERKRDRARRSAASVQQRARRASPASRVVGVPAAAAARRLRPAGAVRHPDHGALRAPERGRRRRFLQQAQKSGMFIFVDKDLKIRPAAVGDRDRPRQGGAAGTEHERRRRRARRRCSAAATSTTSACDGRSYKVIPQVAAGDAAERRPAAELLHRNASGGIPCRCRPSRTCAPRPCPSR